MKLLLELIQTSIKSNTLSPTRSRSNIGLNKADHVRNSVRDKNFDLRLGSGRHADVFSHKTKPGTVLKTISLPSFEQDSTIAFLKYISQNGRAASNPYLPRIYSIKSYKSDNGKDFVAIEMEKLFPFAPSSPEEVFAMGNRMFVDFEESYKRQRREEKGITNNNKVSDRNKEVTIGEHDTDRISQFLVDCLATHLLSASKTIRQMRSYMKKYQGMIANIKDPKLKEAIMILRGIMRSDIGGENDLHMGNVMIRRGPTGAQLVLTDPIGSPN